MNIKSELAKLRDTMGVPEIHMKLNSTGEINVALPTLRSWFYEQRKPSNQNRKKLCKAIAMIKMKPEITTIAIRVTSGDPKSIYTTGISNGIIKILGQNIEIQNRKLKKKSNPAFYRDIHRLLSKYQNQWLRISSRQGKNVRRLQQIWSKEDGYFKTNHKRQSC